MTNKAKFINDTLEVIYGRKVPALYWKNAKDMFISYDEQRNMFLADCGYEEEFPLKTEDISKRSMLDYLDDFEGNVMTFYKNKYGIELILP